MVKLPPSNHIIAESIYKWYAEQANKDHNNLRMHLGASMIGRPCERQLWYSFRWVSIPNIEPRIYRLFNRGQMEEEIFTNDLKAIGCEVVTIDPNTGRQYEFRIPEGHFGGSMDGAARNIPGRGSAWHVLEYKTHNSKSFDYLMSKGVESAKPEHFAQMQVYMGFTGMQRALYCAVCKDDDRLYFEVIKYDENIFVELVNKAKRIIFSIGIPGKISNSPETSNHCKYCDFQAVCHYKAPPLRNCRTCKHSLPKSDGQWYCTFDFFPKYGIDQKVDAALTKDEQINGCEEWEIRNGLDHDN